MAEDLDNTIRENAAASKRAAGDSGSVEQHSLTEQIEADRQLCLPRASQVTATGSKHMPRIDADA